MAEKPKISPLVALMYQAGMFGGGDFNALQALLGGEGRQRARASVDFLTEDAGVPRAQAKQGLKESLRSQLRLKALAPEQYTPPDIGSLVTDAAARGKKVQTGGIDQTTQQILMDMVVQPYLNQLYESQIQNADWFEQTQLERAAQIEDASRRGQAQAAVSNYANLMRFKAASDVNQFFSPYGQEGSFGNLLAQLLGKQQSTFNAFKQQKQPVGQNDFASLALGGGQPTGNTSIFGAGG